MKGSGLRLGALLWGFLLIGYLTADAVSLITLYINFNQFTFFTKQSNCMIA